MDARYFKRFEHRMPAAPATFSRRRQVVWQFLASVTIGLGIWYLHWRWTATLNPDAPVFSLLVVTAETGMFIGTLLFFHDIWRQDDTPRRPPPRTRADAGLDGDGPILVDIFITTYDEDAAIVEPSIIDALAVRA
ncbi:MAG: cellulose synthase, partial [Alphaproteobacteria bacterium]